MRNILLSVYSVRVKTAHTRRDYELIDCFSEKDADLHEILGNLLDRRKTEVYRKADTQQALQVVKFHADKRQLEGLLDIGQYGSESEIRNLDQWDRVAYRKGVWDVDLHPFYFLFDLPEGKNMGILLIQRTGAEGAQAIFAEALHELFTCEFPNQRLQMRQIVPEEFYRQLESEETKLSEVRFVRHRLATDITTVIGPAGTDQTSGTMELALKIKEQGVGVEAIKRYFDRHRAAGSVLELEGTRFPYDSVKIRVTFRGKERTVDLSNPKSMRAAFDITNQVTFSAAGHPTFVSISGVAKGILSDIKDELYGTGPHVPG